MKIVLTGLASLPFGATPHGAIRRTSILFGGIHEDGEPLANSSSRGPAMIPLGILSIITLALILAFLFSMRPGSIATRRYLQTADALIRKRDYLGLLAISNRHNEALARVIQRTMDFFLKKSPGPPSQKFGRSLRLRACDKPAHSINGSPIWPTSGQSRRCLDFSGTVIGIVRSFWVIAIDAAATRPTMLGTRDWRGADCHGRGSAHRHSGHGGVFLFSWPRPRLISELEAATTHLLALLSTSVKPNPAGIQPESMKSHEL